MLKLISIIKLMFKKKRRKSKRAGVEGVNEVEPVIGRGVTPFTATDGDAANSLKWSLEADPNAYN